MFTASGIHIRMAEVGDILKGGSITEASVQVNGIQEGTCSVGQVSETSVQVLRDLLGMVAQQGSGVLAKGSKVSYVSGWCPMG